MENQQDGQLLIDKYYQARLKLNEELRTKNQELGEFERIQNLQTITPLVEFLKENIPPHLRKKVEKYFSFMEADQMKTSIFDLIKSKTFSCIGMTILADIPLSNDEITELNKAWFPVAAIHPQYRSFMIG